MNIIPSNNFNAAFISKNEVFFNNENLNEKDLLEHLIPMAQAITSRIQLTLKSKADVKYLGSYIIKNNLLEHMQFDDLCIKLLHLDSGLEFFFIIGTRLTRTLLIRLLSTSLINEEDNIPLSATERGIFSYVVAKILFEIKNLIGPSSPSIKILGIYHKEDEQLSLVNFSFLGSYNFSFSIANSIFTLSLICQPNIFSKNKEIEFNRLLPLCGHINRYLVVLIKLLKITYNNLSRLRYGDIIIFDHYSLKQYQHLWQGPIYARWEMLAINSNLIMIDNYYKLSINKNPITHKKDIIMEELDITKADNITEQKLLLENMKINVGIEIGKIPITLKDICTLKEGQILDLHKSIDEPLEMVVEDKTIGFCRPVNIEGKLGIKIIKMVA